MIGVFDSGIGGLSVWRELFNLMPEQDYLYFADIKNMPYGNKDLKFIQNRAEDISRFLIDKGAEVVVVACNTATTAAIKKLRDKLNVDFVGIEPATNLAAKLTETRKIGVLATENTLKSETYKDSLYKISPDIKIVNKVGLGLVELIESGKTQGEEIEEALFCPLSEMISEGVDTLVLGCTHYPFLNQTISKIVGDKINIIDPSIYVAARTKYILNLKKRKIPKSENYFYSNGDLGMMKTIVKEIIPSIADDSFIRL